MNSLFLLLVAAASLFTSVLGTEPARRKVAYTGQRVIRCHYSPANDLDTVSLRSRLLNDPLLDVWAIGANGSIDVRVSDAGEAGLRIQRQLEEQFDNCSVRVADVETLVQTFEAAQKQKEQQEWHEEYHRYEDIFAWYEAKNQSHPELVTMRIAGVSYEERPMPAVHITAGSGEEKLKIYFQCQIHAREWISGAVCMFIVHYLLENYGVDERVTTVLNELELIVVPFVNPDGYSYSWDGDRLWRKNRRVNSGTSCRGVDLNRNYNDHWNEGGSSNNPCSETFHGAFAASEPETQVTSNYFMNTGRIVGAIDWHSYSQLILRPYGWTSVDAPDEPWLKALGDGMSAVAYEVHNRRYTSQKSIGLYPTTGSADDWFYGEEATAANRGYRAAGYTIELRDTGQYGFLLPPDQIIPNGEEMVAAALYFCQACLDNPIPAPSRLFFNGD
ncbi:carboxypeptidase B-like isoform X1 [Oscarella lobularis]|uniref:carboxypeptidase B-like isoform X1 n=1 Tax=Oscarella lobularis TaxID=121494 RepID=UPI00331362D2